MLTYRIKVDLIKLLALVVTATKHIEFSVANSENFIESYHGLYGFSIDKTTSSTTCVVYVGGSSVTKTNSAILDISETNDCVIFDGTFDETTYFDTFMFFIIKGAISLDIDGKTNLILYKQDSENDKIDKTLIYVDMMQGKFNSAIGLKNINIDVINHEFNYNYVYIPKLKRYYYVDSVELITADYTRLHLKEDVLMSWKDLIREQVGYVSRSENGYSDIEDSKRTTYLDPIYSVETINVDVFLPEEQSTVGYDFRYVANFFD